MFGSSGVTLFFHLLAASGLMSRTTRPLVVTSSENPFRGKVEKTKRTPQQQSKSLGRNPLANITNIPGGFRAATAKPNPLPTLLAQLSPPIDQDDEVLAEDNEIEDIDRDGEDDPQAVSEYVNEIYEYSFAQELAGRIPHQYMNQQPDINEKMRAILIDWLVEVHATFKLLPETLFLAGNLVDRFLAIRPVTRDKLQLIGLTALLIASKYEEIYPPEIQDYVFIADNAYSKETIITMEEIMLNTLEWDLSSPSPLFFLRRWSKAAGSDYSVHTLGKYMIETSLLDVNFLKFRPSEIAAAAIFLSRSMASVTPVWNPTLAHYTKYDHDHVYLVARELNDLLNRTQRSSLKAIQTKYTSPKNGQVARLPLVEI